MALISKIKQMLSGGRGDASAAGDRHEHSGSEHGLHRREPDTPNPTPVDAQTESMEEQNPEGVKYRRHREG